MARFDLKQYLKDQKNGSLVLKPLVDKFFLRCQDLGSFSTETRELVEELLKARETPRDPFGAFSPSGSKRCLVEQALTILGNKPTRIDDPMMLNLFDDGHWRHLRWHTIFWRMHEMGLLTVLAIEERVEYPAWFVGGTPDDIVEIAGTKYVVDIKGMNVDKFNHLIKTNVAPEAYIYQVHVYMVAHDIEWAILLVECKNDQRYTEVLIKRDPKLVAELRLRYKYLNKARKRKKILNPKFGCSRDPNDRVYRWCSQRNNCVRLFPRETTI